MTAIMRFLARSGAAITNPFHPQRNYIRPRAGDASRDFGKISGDMRRVGEDLRKVTLKECAKYRG